jgi:hypothetical protein
MSEIMRDTADYIDLQAENILKDYKGGLPVSLFAEQHAALRRAIIIKMCENAGGRLNFNLAEELDAALLRQDLPGNMAAEVRDGNFRIYKEAAGYRARRKEIKRKINKEI